tara:strand:- start:101 stop:1183 length:1083 start_codon:yes stop_codon:yes gene_type:complete
MERISGKIIINDKIISGNLLFNNKVIEIIDDKTLNNENFILPGFIDLHCHGGNGFDTMEGLESIVELSKYHLENGTTTFFPTTVTASYNDTFKALNGLNDYINRNKFQINIEGIHLEGPFINPKKLGAQPPFTQIPNLDFIKNLLKQAPIKIITLAPEIDGGLDLIERLIELDIKPQIGHTLASTDICNLSINKGVESFTHLYNAMSGFDHREPGAVASAFANLNYSEIICDLIHVHPYMIKLAYKNIKDLYVITDCISASGMKDGEYNLGVNRVFKKGNIVKLNNKTLGGSILTMQQAFKNLLKIGFSIIEAVQMTSTNAAKYLNRKDIGNLNVGSYANILVLDKNFNILKVFLNGKIC